MGLAVAGLVLVQATSAAGGAATLVGNLLVGGAVLCEASFVMLGKRLAPPYRPLRLALGANLVGPGADGAAGADRSGRPSIGARCAIDIWLLGTWYALAASVICLWLWYRGLPHVETWLAGLATAAMPVAALAARRSSWARRSAPARLAGAALVIAAIVMGALSAPRQVPRA